MYDFILNKYLRQTLTDFQAFFSGTFCGKFPITWLLNITTP